MTKSVPYRKARRTRAAVGWAAFVAVALLSDAAAAQPTSKTFIDYIQPTPITCPPLGSGTWGIAGVLPRDTCNGIESAVIPPAFYYWDGKIIRAGDGTYHLFSSSWPGPNGFNPGWLGSDPIHAVSDAGVLGPYQRLGFAYDDPSLGSDPHHGHNVSAAVLLDGTYALYVSEVVPFTVFTSSSLDGPWAPCPPMNGDRIQTNGVSAGTDTHWDSNVSLVVRPDGRFEIVQRHGLIGVSDTLCGPYLLQTPTNTYPANEQPPFASIYPNRHTHSSADPQAPPTVENTYSLAEDPVIWFSGGQYHVLYDYPDDRVGYHLSSPDGIHNWSDQGLAYDSRLAQRLFSYVGNATVNHWFKMERPAVVLENGHITHVTWAVSDVDKNNQIPGGSNHGSKVIVVPFDGVLFDQETSDAGAGDGGGPGGGGSDAAKPPAEGGNEGGGSDATRSGEGGGDASAIVGADSSSGGGASAGDATASGGGSNGTMPDGGRGPEGNAAVTGGGGGGGCGCRVIKGGPAGAASAEGALVTFAACLWVRVRRRRAGGRTAAPDRVVPYDGSATAVSAN